MANSQLQLPSVRITRRHVYIDNVKLPGFIEEDGVVVAPGGFKRRNRLTVTFLVGHIEAIDPTEADDDS
jgi:hypothetical protein